MLALVTGIAAEGAASGQLLLGLSVSADALLVALTLAWRPVLLRPLLCPLTESARPGSAAATR